MKRNPEFINKVINIGVQRISKKLSILAIDKNGESLKDKLLLFYQKYPAAKTCMIETEDNIIYYRGSRANFIEVANVKQLSSMTLEAIDKTFHQRVIS